MSTQVRNLVVALVLGSGVLLAPLAAPASAAPMLPAAPVSAVDAQQAGLVNVNVSLNNVCIVCNLQTTVQVAAAIAANVCGTAVQVGVLAQQIQQVGGFSCEAGTAPNLRQVSITRA